MKISFFTNMKDRLNKLSKSNVVYQFPCPGCESSNIGKTERTLFERTKEHVTRADSVIEGHLDKLNVEHLFPIHNLVLNDVNAHDFRLSFGCHNTRSIVSQITGTFYCLKEHKDKCSTLNNGVKAFRDM